MNQLPVDLDELNLKLQEFVGMTTEAKCVALLSDESSISTANAKILSSEVAEQIGMMAVNKYLAEYSVFAPQRHPNGAGRFPDCRIEGAPIEFKSWLLMPEKKDNKPTYSGANLNIFAEAIARGDDSYLRAIYIVVELQCLANGGYWVASVRAGRIWNFCAGGISGEGNSRYLRSSGSKDDPGVSPRSFARELERNARNKGVSVSALDVLRLIEATGVADLDSRYQWKHNRRAITSSDNLENRRRFPLEEAVGILKRIEDPNIGTMVEIDNLQKMDKKSILAVTNKLKKFDPRIKLMRMLPIDPTVEGAKGYQVDYKGDPKAFAKQKRKPGERLVIGLPPIDSRKRSA